MELTKIYQHAIKNNYALGAFNFYNLESMTAILETAQKLSTPVIMGVSESAFKYFGAEFLKGAIASAKKTYNIPFFVHLVFIPQTNRGTLPIFSAKCLYFKRYFRSAHRNRVIFRLFLSVFSKNFSAILYICNLRAA